MNTATCVALSLRAREAALKLAQGGETIGQQSDAALVLLARHEPNGLAFQELLIRHYDYVRRLVGRRGTEWGWRWDAIEDAQSDATFAIIQAIDRFDPNRSGSNGRPCSFRTFLTGVVVDQLIDFGRKRKRYRQRNEISLDSGHAAGHQTHCACRRCRQVAAAVLSNEPDPAEVAEQNERAVRLQHAIARLKPIYRGVAELVLADPDISIQEIAAELKINVECAKKRRTKSHAMLKRLLT